MIFQVIWCDNRYFCVWVLVCVYHVYVYKIGVVFCLTSLLLCRVVIDNNACENATVIQVKLVVPLCLGFTKLSWQLERFFFFLLSVFHMIWFDVIKLVFSSVLVSQNWVDNKKDSSRFLFSFKFSNDLMLLNPWLYFFYFSLSFIWYN